VGSPAHDARLHGPVLGGRRRAHQPRLVALGVFSVLLWARIDDLRLYGVVQFYPVLAIPLILWAFPARYSHGSLLLAAIGCYVGAKLLEDADGRLFALGQFVSGHTLKHLAAAAGGWCVYRMLVVRQPLLTPRAGVPPAAA
jgi:hypothetical protein